MNFGEYIRIAQLITFVHKSMFVTKHIRHLPAQTGEKQF